MIGILQKPREHNFSVTFDEPAPTAHPPVLSEHIDGVLYADFDNWASTQVMCPVCNVFFDQIALDSHLDYCVNHPVSAFSILPPIQPSYLVLPSSMSPLVHAAPNPLSPAPRPLPPPAAAAAADADTDVSDDEFVQVFSLSSFLDHPFAQVEHDAAAEDELKDFDEQVNDFVLIDDPDYVA